MESNMTTSQLPIKNENNAKQTATLLGSAKRFRSVTELWDHITQRPLLVNALSQTTSSDFLFLNQLEVRDLQTKKENELEKKVRELQDNLGKHRELLAQIHATAVKTSSLLEQQQSQNHQYTISTGSNYNNDHSISNNRDTQLSPKIFESINSNHQSDSPSESLKCTIRADNTGEPIYEPIEIELAEEDGALNLNGSAHYESQEICIAPEENTEIETEDNTANNAMRNAYRPVGISSNSTTNEHLFINKRNPTDGQHELPITSTHYEGRTIESFGNIRLELPTTKPHNITLNMPSTSNKNLQSSPHCHNLSESSNGVDGGNDMVLIGPNNTHVPKNIYDNINWSSASAATGKLLMTIFGRTTLATHSMSGKPSPAFMDRHTPTKPMLDPLIISDVIFAVTRKCNVSAKEVRISITTKCASENKRKKLKTRKSAPIYHFTINCTMSYCMDCGLYRTNLYHDKYQNYLYHKLHITSYIQFNM